MKQQYSYRRPALMTLDKWITLETQWRMNGQGMGIASDGFNYLIDCNENVIFTAVVMEQDICNIASMDTIERVVSLHRGHF